MENTPQTINDFINLLQQIYFNAVDHKCFPIAKQIIKNYPPSLKKFRKHRQLSNVMLATCSGNIDFVKFILDEGDREFDNFNHSVLNIAASRGYVEIFKLLIKYGANPFNNEKIEQTFYTAGTCGCGQTHDSVPKKIKIEKSTKPLVLSAVLSGNLEMIQFLKEIGVSLTEISKCNVGGLPKGANAIDFTMMHFYGDTRPNIEIIKFLIHEGCDVVGRHMKKAIDIKYPELVKLFYDQGAHLEYINPGHMDLYLSIHLLLPDCNNTFDTFGLQHRMAVEGNSKLLEEDELEYFVYKHDFEKNEYSFGVFKVTPLLILIYKGHYELFKQCHEKFKVQINVIHLKYAILYNQQELIDYCFKQIQDNNISINALLKDYRDDKTSTFNAPIQTLMKLWKNKHIKFNNPELLLLNFMYNDHLEGVKFLLENVFQLVDLNQVEYHDRMTKRIFNVITIEQFVWIMEQTNFKITEKLFNKYFFQGFYVKFPRKHHFQKIIWLLQHQPEIIDLNELEICLKKYKNTTEKIQTQFLYSLPRSHADKYTNKSQKLYSEYVPIIEDILDNLDTCKICFAKVPKTSGSCGHKVLCVTCFEKVDNCPQCTLSLK